MALSSPVSPKTDMLHESSLAGAGTSMVFPPTRTLHWELLIAALIVFSLPRMMLTESVSTFLKIPASSLGVAGVGWRRGA